MRPLADPLLQQSVWTGIRGFVQTVDKKCRHGGVVTHGLWPCCNSFSDIWQ
jgi:hypothetical protein